ncbi:MarR family transcriptional regulator [Alicyclobacillus contaminans]|uniref:MarR family winged helix-turn-helix transcriptional regulator n=1 Tax=Alicyclobacillus contaminans TaxID=392016 RepID=UPI00041E0D7C|nr:MarR family winged helix-turn-helix transcriptional regulator [Alicyclobacillus contaminans]GMA52297.1 MarR family transcriptional regulator [Alicyclobacillus contaminans]
MTDPTTNDYEQQLQDLEDVLTRFQRTIRSFFMEQSPGLTASQIFTLRYLCTCRYAKASDIARVSGLSAGAVTQVCDELVKMGYVERIRSSDDRRVVHVRVTDEGRARFAAIRTLRARSVRGILEQLGAEDTREFLRIVARIVEIVEDESNRKGSCT